jgi:hypothetical protein
MASVYFSQEERATARAHGDLDPDRECPHAEPRTKAARVNNGGAFPPADARTYRPEEGSDDETFDATPQSGEVVGSLY